MLTSVHGRRTYPTAPLHQPAETAPELRVQPLELVPCQDSAVVKGQGWSGINKPIKAEDSEGKVFVAKDNTLGTLKALFPEHDTRRMNINEIVMSHIVADEFHLPALTFQEAYVTHNGERVLKEASVFQPNIKTLEQVSVKAITQPAVAVALSVVQGWGGDFDSTFNDSNVWVLPSGSPYGSDYGFAMRKGVGAAGIPYANHKVMMEFANKETVRPILHKIRNLTDQDIYDMVNRQGTKWIHDWNGDLCTDMAKTLIHNRNVLRKSNPYAQYYPPANPLLHPAIVQTRFPAFWWGATHPHIPWDRPDQMAGVLASGSKFFKMGQLEKFFLRAQQKLEPKAES